MTDSANIDLSGSIYFYLCLCLDRSSLLDRRSSIDHFSPMFHFLIITHCCHLLLLFFQSFVRLSLSSSIHQQSDLYMYASSMAGTCLPTLILSHASNSRRFFGAHSLTVSVNSCTCVAIAISIIMILEQFSYPSMRDEA